MLPVIRWVLSELYTAEIDAEQFRGLAAPPVCEMIDILRENTAVFAGRD